MIAQSGFDVVTQHQLGEYMIALSVVLLTIWFMFRISRRRRGDAGAEEQLAPRERIERVKQMGGMRNDLRELMVEIEQMARRVGAQLDAKTIHLEKLLQEADEKIASLDQSTPSAPDLEPEQPVMPELDPLTTKVYELSDEGRDSIQIAQQLNEHVGKVELMLALRQKSA